LLTFLILQQIPQSRFNIINLRQNEIFELRSGADECIGRTVAKEKRGFKKSLKLNPEPC
jgi:hypothetical protein